MLRLVEDLIMMPLDRSRPLWHLRFVTGLSDDRIALVERAHHAMIDGVSGVDVSLVLLDTSPDAPPHGTTTAWSPRPTPSPSALLLDGLRDRLEAPVDAAWRAVQTLRHPTAVARGFAGATGSFATLRHNGVTAPRSSLNVQIGSSRRLTIVRQHLDDVKQAGKAANATVNDVVLAAVAGGLRSLLLARGESLATNQQLKILVPVSVRTSGESMSLGNRVGAMLMPLPIGIGDPGHRLEMIAATTRTLKNSDEASTADFLLQATDLLPQTMARIVQRGVNHQPLVNMVVTNVPGPPFPLYAMGARMLEAFPVVPLGGNMSLEVAILSYNGALNLCVTSDRETCPDAHEFVDGLERAFAGLGASWTPALERKGGAFPLGSS